MQGKTTFIVAYVVEKRIHLIGVKLVALRQVVDQCLCEHGNLVPIFTTYIPLASSEGVQVVDQSSRRRVLSKETIQK